MAIFTNQSKHIVSIQNLNKQGSSWRYEESDLLYEMNNLYYETFGALITFTNQPKHNSTIINQPKS